MATLAHLSSFPMPEGHKFIFSMPPSEISFLIRLGQKNCISIFQIFTPHACGFASDITTIVRFHIFSKEVAVYPGLIDSISNGHSGPIIYARESLLWHCQNTPPSASLQLCEEIINFSLHRPDSCFANNPPGMSLFYFVPQFLQFIKTLVCLTSLTPLI